MVLWDHSRVCFLALRPYRLKDLLCRQRQSVALTLHLWLFFLMAWHAFLKEHWDAGKKIKHQWGEGQAHINVIFSWGSNFTAWRAYLRRSRAIKPNWWCAVQTHALHGIPPRPNTHSNAVYLPLCTLTMQYTHSHPERGREKTEFTSSSRFTTWVVTSSTGSSLLTVSPVDVSG